MNDKEKALELFKNLADTCNEVVKLLEMEEEPTKEEQEKVLGKLVLLLMQMDKL